MEADWWEAPLTLKDLAKAAKLQKKNFKREAPNPNNEKYFVKTIEYKLQYVVYDSITTSIANLIFLDTYRT